MNRVQHRNAAQSTVMLGGASRLGPEEWQRVWINTDDDNRPEFMLRSTDDDAYMFKMKSWSETGRAIGCDGGWTRFSLGSKLTIHLPKKCLSYKSKIRLSVRSLDRYHNDASYRQDFWPAMETRGPCS